jgi:hypothetical protein
VVFLPLEFDIGPDVLGFSGLRFAAFAQTTVHMQFQRTGWTEKKVIGLVPVSELNATHGVIVETTVM